MMILEYISLVQYKDIGLIYKEENMSNRIELEKSFILDEENERRIQGKLEQEGFKLVSEEVEEDTYFSDKELNFVKNRVCLRTRKINYNHLELTYKPKSTEETEKFGKKEVNIELNVKDYEDIKYIIKQLGYIEYVSFKKYRTTYSKNVNGIERNIINVEASPDGKWRLISNADYYVTDNSKRLPFAILGMDNFTNK